MEGSRDNELQCEADYESPFEITILQNDRWLAGINGGDGTKLILRNNEDENLNILNAMNMTKIGNLNICADWIRGAVFDDTTKLIATLNGDGNVTVYEESKNDAEGKYEIVSTWNCTTRGSETSGLHFNGDGSKVILCSICGTIRVLGLGNRADRRVWQAPQMSEVRKAISTSEGEHFVTGHKNGEVFLWEAKTGKQSGNCLTVHNTEVCRLGMSKNGEWIVTLSKDGIVALSIVQSREVSKSFKIESSDHVYGLDVNCDGTRVVFQFLYGTIQIWDTSETSGPFLVIPREKRTRDTYWFNVWFDDFNNCIAAESTYCIEEWDASSGSYVKSRNFSNPHSYASREIALNALTRPESQDIGESDKPDVLFVGEDHFKYGKEDSNRVLATFEARFSSILSCSPKWNTFLVSSDNGDVRFFRLFS